MSAKTKIYIRFMGGLGNQMFQYAAAQVYKQMHGGEIYGYTGILADAYVPRKYDLDIFKNIDLKFTKTLPKEYHRICRYGEFGFKSSDTKPIILDGFFQDVRVFSYQNLFNDFEINKLITPQAQNLAANITKKDLCINIRRADYVSNPSALETHGFLGQKYVDVAISKFSEIDKVYIFSDEPEWCRENITTRYDTTIVGHDHAGPKYSDYLYLMSKFDNMIIPNSTFAWWAAVFKLHRDVNTKVACPDSCLWYVSNSHAAWPLLAIDQKIYKNFIKIKRSHLSPQTEEL